MGNETNDAKLTFGEGVGDEVACGTGESGHRGPIDGPRRGSDTITASLRARIAELEAALRGMRGEAVGLAAKVARDALALDGTDYEWVGDTLRDHVYQCKKATDAIARAARGAG